MSETARVHPIEVGQTHEVTALRLNDDGDGVATVGGMTVFIPFLLPGEAATIRVTAVEKRFARAEVQERKSTSPDRQDAPCPVFGTCGGCQVQHLTYDAQTQWKEGRIRRIASQLGLDADAIVQPIVTSEDPFRYRNQVQMPVRFNSAEGRVEMGFYGAETHDLIPTDSCHLQSEAMQRTLNRARNFLTSLGEEMASAVHHIIVRESHTTDEQLVVFAVFHGEEALRAAVGRFHSPNVKTVALTVQPKLGGPVWGRKVDLLRGTGELSETLGGIPFRVSSRSFLQVQSALAEKMYETVLHDAAITPKDTVIDAYSGIGTLTLMLAKQAKRAIGVEEIAAAVADAEANQAANRINNVAFHTTRVETWLPKWMKDGGRTDVIVFDPPRKGIDKGALLAVIAAKVPRIVYASCNPATMQRDLKELLAGGYKVERMQPFDMFPQTAHVECVVSLVRK